MTRPTILIALCAALAGCGGISLPGVPFFNRVQPSEPLPFKSSLDAGRGARDFRVAVAQGNADLEIARESIRFPATRYCLQTFGSTRIDWVSAAGQPSAWVGQRAANGTTVYSGRCDPR